MSIIRAIISILINNKALILLGFILICVFTILLLPYQDINTYISSQIRYHSKAQVQFKAKQFFIAPSLSLVFKDNVLTYKKWDIPFNRLSINILWLQSLLLNYGIQINADSIFGGKINLQINKNKNKQTPWSVKTRLENISLNQLNLNAFKFNGKISAFLKILLDPQFFNTPNIQIQIKNHNKLQSFSTKIPSAFGPIQIPAMEFSKLQLIAKTNKDILSIKNLQLGSAQDRLQIKTSGSVRLKIKKIRTGNTLSIDYYKLLVYIKAKQIPSKLQSLFALIDNYKVGHIYQFYITGKDLMSVPKITAKTGR